MQLGRCWVHLRSFACSLCKDQNHKVHALKMLQHKAECGSSPEGCIILLPAQVTSETIRPLTNVSSGKDA